LQAGRPDQTVSLVRWRAIYTSSYKKYHGRVEERAMTALSGEVWDQCAASGVDGRAVTAPTSGRRTPEGG
jgi:hypothetical protein